MLWMIWLNNIKIRIYIKKKIIDYRRFRILEYYIKWNEIINLIAPGNWYTYPSHRISVHPPRKTRGRCNNILQGVSISWQYWILYFYYCLKIWKKNLATGGDTIRRGYKKVEYGIFKDYKNEKLILRIKPKKYEYNQKK